MAKIKRRLEEKAEWEGRTFEAPAASSSSSKRPAEEEEEETDATPAKKKAKKDKNAVVVTKKEDVVEAPAVEESKEEEKKKPENKGPKKTAAHLAVTTEFADLDISRQFLRALKEMNFTSPTGIQEKCIPEAMKGEDILATAETGSGKTAAFLLPMLERIAKAPHVLARKRNAQGKVVTGRVATKGLIMTPTRELAGQCYSMLQGISKYSLITSAMVVGGFSASEQVAALKSQPDILICTPGRILDHLINAQAVHLEMLEIVVLDEADRLLELGFLDECKEILKRCSRGRQTLLFSATFNTDVSDLASIALKKPMRIQASKVNKCAQMLEQEFVQVSSEEYREATLVSLCQNTYKEMVIIFFATKKQAHRMAMVFGLLGLPFAELHGNLSQTDRCDGIEAFQNGRAQFLLATDLAARGLDIADVETVINYECPVEEAKYIHRSGRTARMGATGRSVTLHCGEEEKKRVKKFAKLCASTVLTDSDGKKADKETLQKNSVVKKRTVAEEPVVAAWNAIHDLESDIADLVEEEQTERELRLADTQITRAENMDKYKAEIKARPGKQWIISNREKEERREEQKKEREEREKIRTEGESRKQRIKREAKEAKRESELRIQAGSKRKFKSTGIAGKAQKKKKTKKTSSGKGGGKGSKSKK